MLRLQTPGSVLLAQHVDWCTPLGTLDWTGADLVADRGLSNHDDAVHGAARLPRVASFVPNRLDR